MRVDATDDASWAKFQTYFKLIGPGSHFIRRVLLGSLVERFGSPNGIEASMKLAGDELLPDAQAQVHGGVGFTWDCDAHFHYKRAKVNDTLLGSQGHHRQRLAELLLDAV